MNDVFIYVITAVIALLACWIYLWVFFYKMRVDIIEEVRTMRRGFR